MIPLPRPLLIALGVLLAATAALAFALTLVATRRPRVVVVPGVRDAQVVLAEEVPDSAVRKFGLLYVYHFDNYTPATIEERSNWLLRFVAPEFQERAARSLTERGNYVLRTKEASQLVPPLPEACPVTRTPEGLFRFEAVATRNVFIAGELKTTTRVRYVLELRPVLPTDEDPYGFVVVGQSVKEVADEAR